LTYIFQHKDIKLHFRKIGSGKTPIVAFHGFTRSSVDYELFEPFIKDDYTIFAIDLFYHGKTQFNSKKWKSFSKKELKEIFEAFLKHIEVKRFQVLGYSMGGRVALFLIEQFAKRVDHLYLLAPDGLKTNFWNWFVTSTKAGKGIYGLAISNPGIVYSISNTGQKLNLFPSSMSQFLDINFSTKGLRLRIYRVWKLYKNISLPQYKLAEIINDNSIKTDIIVGHKDPVVKPELCEKFYLKIEENATFHKIKAGHDLFRPHVIKFFQNNIF